MPDLPVVMQVMLYRQCSYVEVGGGPQEDIHHATFWSASDFHLFRVSLTGCQLNRYAIVMLAGEQVWIRRVDSPQMVIQQSEIGKSGADKLCVQVVLAPPWLN
jgi:hypothetical protein